MTEPIVDHIGILILDDDIVSQGALWQVLDSEGWQIRMIKNPNLALAELAKGEASLVIANVVMTGLSGPIFETLKILSQASAGDGEGAKTPARVLFLVPAGVAPEAQPLLEKAGLPFLLKPYHLHDFLGKISDLLLEANAITASMRNVQDQLKVAPRPLVRSGTRLDARRTDMFAGRGDYSMTEEELLEYERQEEATKKKKNPKRDDYIS
jgi:DNA-binding NtrC family response regulator